MIFVSIKLRGKFHMEIDIHLRLGKRVFYSIVVFLQFNAYDYECISPILVLHSIQFNAYDYECLAASTCLQVPQGYN